MRFGTVYSFQDPPGSPIGHERVYASALEQIARSEQQGYTWLNLTEHHVSDDGYGNALLPVLAAAAARTTSLRLSTGMLILPLHDPVRIAEEAAVVDVISGGRLTLGVAVGYRETEFQALGTDFATRGKRFEESLEIMRRAWTGEAFSYDGEIFTIPEVAIGPRPVQRPHPPLWIGGTTDPALRRAVRLGSPLCPGGVAPVALIEQDIARFRELGGAEDAGLVLPRFAVVADTVEEARARALPALRTMFDRYRMWGAPAELSDVLNEWAVLDEVVVVGDEARCAEIVERYAALGVTDLMLQFALSTLDPDVIAESQERFARVMAG